MAPPGAAGERLLQPVVRICGVDSAWSAGSSGSARVLLERVVADDPDRYAASPVEGNVRRITWLGACHAAGGAASAAKLG
jgi:hypothetical protein